MAEVKEEQKIISVDMVCDKCGKGRMRCDTIVYDSVFTQYPHTCTECGYEETYDVRYPHFEYVNTDEVKLNGKV